MRRFFLPPDRTCGRTLTLDGPEAHHALDVLRLRQGNDLTVLNGAGEVLECRIVEAARRSATIEVIRRTVAPPPAFSVTLLQAAPKGKTMDLIVQKAVELGASCIVPLLTEHCEVHYTDDRSMGKTAKWRAIAVEAMKQCGAAWMPQIQEPISPGEWIGKGQPSAMSLIASLQSGARHARFHFENFRSVHGAPPANVSIWIGPEGDFTREETEAILSSGALPITLGPRILRAETAAFYCLSVVQHELAFCPAPAVVERPGR